MNSAGFDATCWNHWLLIGCFVGISSWGLYLWRQWSSAAQTKRKQARLARRLSLETQGIEQLQREKSFLPKRISAYQKSFVRR